jgi:hypothetical protein
MCILPINLQYSPPKRNYTLFWQIPTPVTLHKQTNWSNSKKEIVQKKKKATV